MDNIARSLVDNRQPFFKDGKDLLTVDEKLYGEIVILPELKCNCWDCNRKLFNSKNQGEIQ